MILDQLKYNYAVKHLAVEADVTEDYSYAELQETGKARIRSVQDSWRTMRPCMV